jgi:hypothetical protein
LNIIRSSLNDLDIDLASELSDYLNIQAIIIEIESGNSDLSEVVGSHEEFLMSVAEISSYIGQATAQALLQLAGLAEFPEVIKLPEPSFEKKAKVINEDYFEKLSFDDIINVYPNPAHDIVYIEYAFANSNKNGRSILIYDLNGRLIEQFVISQQVGVAVLENKLSSGQYIIRIGENFDKKLIVN